MSYGWAILSIAVILGGLFALGVFNQQVQFKNNCLGTVGYICSTPVLNTTGNLSVQLGYTGTVPITITGINCSAGSVTPAPSKYVAQNIQLNPGIQTKLIFKCPIGGSKLALPFTGTLWIKYNQGSVNNQMRPMGTVSTIITTTGSV